jgi:hypothetical protein
LFGAIPDERFRTVVTYCCNGKFHLISPLTPPPSRHFHHTEWDVKLSMSQVRAKAFAPSGDMLYKIRTHSWLRGIGLQGRILNCEVTDLMGEISF